MSLLTIFVLVIAAAIIFMGAIVFARRRTENSSLPFALFCALVGVWIVANYLGANYKESNFAPFMIHVDFFVGAWMSLLFYLFVRAFTQPENDNKILRSAMYPLIFSTVAVSILSIGEFFIILARDQAGIISIDYLDAYIFYTFGLTVPLLVGLISLVFTYYKSKAQRRDQIGIMFAGLGFAISIVALSNLVLPLVTREANINLLAGNIAYIAIAVFIGTAAYVIVKHRLFDVRSFAVRAVVYGASLLLIAAIFSLLVIQIGPKIFGLNELSISQQIFVVLGSLLIAVCYSPLVRFFNKSTKRIFYRDAYDTQEVLDKVGKIIVASIDLHKIQKSSLEVLLAALRPTYGGFILKDGAGSVRIQDFVGEVPKFDAAELAKITTKIGKQGVVYDELDQTTTEYAQLLRKNDISLVVPLITKNETIGYFIAGPKKSGNIYNQQDKKMLTIAANELAVALQNAQRFEEIQAFNITLQEKVAEATRELKKTNKKLVELDEAKDEFISMASHQLRTPLTSIKGYISMLMEGDLGKVSKSQEQALKEAYTSSQRMVFLIADFLNVSRIRTGKFVIEPKEVDLSEMVTEELVQLKEMAESKQLKLVYEKPANFPKVKLDENKMHQVMMNMIDNAIYYTPENGSVTIQLFVDGKDVVFKVIDTGIGVPKHEQHKLFTKFFRAGNARKARPDGTGLGLFMAQKVIVAQNGIVIFESTEGKGSTFGFRFPLSKIKM